jgi:xanthine dehydrogenase accessory factor
VVGHLDDQPVPAPIDGVLRGLVRDSTLVPAGVKLLEIDARGRTAQWTGTDQRGRANAEATATAIRLRAVQPEPKDTGAGLLLI